MPSDWLGLEASCSGVASGLESSEAMVAVLRCEVALRLARSSCRGICRCATHGGHAAELVV